MNHAYTRGRWQRKLRTEGSFFLSLKWVNAKCMRRKENCVVNEAVYAFEKQGRVHSRQNRERESES